MKMTCSKCVALEEALKIAIEGLNNTDGSSAREYEDRVTEILKNSGINLS